jgi:FixJ family two-component response regulator
MNDFIPKPITVESLLTTVERVGREVRSRQADMRVGT